MADPFDDLVASHAQWGRATVASYLGWWKHWQAFLKVPWDQAERHHIEEFRRELLWQPLARGGLRTANTIDQALRFLRHLYRWAHEQKLTEQNPMDGWLLPRPPQPAQNPLSVAQFLQLCNAPDLSRPAGQADLVLLHLLYQGWSGQRCRQLTLGDLDEVPKENALQEALTAYLERGRPALLKRPTSFVLLSSHGHYRSDQALLLRLRRYTGVLDRLLSPRLLAQSRRAHETQAGQRLPRDLGPGRKNAHG